MKTIKYPTSLPPLPAVYCVVVVVVDDVVVVAAAARVGLFCFCFRFCHVVVLCCVVLFYFILLYVVLCCVFMCSSVILCLLSSLQTTRRHITSSCYKTHIISYHVTLHHTTPRIHNIT